MSLCTQELGWDFISIAKMHSRVTATSSLLEGQAGTYLGIAYLRVEGTKYGMKERALLRILVRTQVYDRSL